MNVTFISTKVIDDTHYADLLLIDGKKLTILMGKSEEPNIFTKILQEEGDTLSSIWDTFNSIGATS